MRWRRGPVPSPLLAYLVILQLSSHQPWVCGCQWTGGRCHKEYHRTHCLDIAETVPTSLPLHPAGTSQASHGTYHYDKVILAAQNLTYIPNEAFVTTPTVELNLTKNWLNTTECIAAGAFRGLEHSLQVLMLSDTGLREVPSESLAVLGRLRVLHLENNEITHVVNLTFINNTALQELYLYQNRIVQIETQAFASLSNLMHLKLWGNKLETLPPGVFRDLSRLVTLDLSENKLLGLDGEVFANLSKLRNLELQENKLTLLDQDTFRGLKRLETVRLLSNPLRRIHRKAFRAVRRLLYLALDIIHTETVDPKMFKGLKKLQMLILGEVDSSAIPPTLFAPLKDLGFMSISNKTGHFFGLSEDAFSSSRNLSKIGIWVEPIVSECSCDAPWIKRLRAGGIGLVKGECSNPAFGDRKQTIYCMNKSPRRKGKRKRRKNKKTSDSSTRKRRTRFLV